MYVYIYIHIYTYIYICVCVCMCIYIYMRTGSEKMLSDDGLMLSEKRKKTYICVPAARRC